MTIGFNAATEAEQKTVAKLKLLKELLSECQNEAVKVWLRDKINQLLIELLPS